MNDFKNSRFKSYIDESDLENISLNDAQKTKLLEGEHLVQEAQKVMMYAQLSDKSKSIFGILTVTTFKMSFATSSEDENDVDACCQHNMLLGFNEICLSSVDTIYQLGDRSKKKLTPGSNVSGKVKELVIVCKNMRAFHFSFKYSEKDAGKQIANALLVHAYPKRHSLLFAYEYKEPYYKTIRKDIRYFRQSEDWEKEMSRSNCREWRLSYVNANFNMSQYLPEFIVVPKSVTDSHLKQAVEHFRNCCCPVWVWSSPKGASLVRMADLLPTITDRTQENILLEHVRKSHKSIPYIMDLTKECPTPKEIQNSYIKLRELCVPDSIRLFKAQDFKFYGLLDSTKWLFNVSICLKKAVEAVEKLSVENITVVLQEGNGHDMNCVLSSLIQILLDPCWRTVGGFQSLIQKEWVALGHPFASRLGHILSHDIEPSPLFLLFLECIWQLLQQYPQAFQFSETYLTTLWDSAHLSIFETFLFNCEHDRLMAQRGSSDFIFRSIWDWSEQFSEKDISLFCNPLFDDVFKDKLQPNPGIPFLEIWSQCYFRWLPDLEIRNGGKPQIELINKFVVAEIFSLYQELKGNVNGTIDETKEEKLQLLKKVNSFFPFSHNNGQIPGILPVNLLSGDVLDSQSILNLAD